MKKYSLDGNWKLFYEDNYSDDAGEITAVVPGNVELDFIRAGLLPEDIFYAQNIRLAEKFETYDFTYEKTFKVKNPENKYKLVFNGVDCIADYYLNDAYIGSTGNALVEHTFDVTGMLEKTNTIRVEIKSTMIYASEQSYNIRQSACGWGNQTPESTFMRKPAHSFSWDIMPRSVSAGIYREVFLVEYGEVEFSQFYMGTVKIDDTVARLFCAFEFESDKLITARNGYKLVVKGNCDGHIFETEHKLRFKSETFYFNIENPKLWWCKNYGEPNLYAVTATLYDGEKVLCEKQINLGIRTIELKYSDYATKDSGEFCFILNGVEIYAQGTNWVPLSPYHSQDKDRLSMALQTLDDTNSNMVRAWGGNVYERDEFFDFTDKHGILVWQDFAFGCALYPYDDDFKANVLDEAEKVVKRLRQHPSIALWAGDNEIDLVHLDYGYDPAQNKINREWLKGVVCDHDRFRPYLESSPFVSQKAYENGGQDYAPEIHLWGNRPYFKSPMYTQSNARFVSEAGYPSAPNIESALKFIPQESLDNYSSDDWITHQVDWYLRDYRFAFVKNQVVNYFGFCPDTYAEFAPLSQIAQAEAFKFLIEFMRSNKPNKRGLLWWNMMDGWPNMTEAVVDYYFKRKKAFNVIARSQQGFTMTVTTDSENRLNLIALNDTNKNIKVNYTVIDGETDEIYANGCVETLPRINKKLGLLPISNAQKRLLIIKFDGDEEGFNHYIVGEPSFDPTTVKKWYETIKDLEAKYE